MTANHTPSTSDISPARLHAEACIDCGTPEPPLHPAGTLSVPDGDLVRDYDTVKCTACLTGQR
ncbi:hypothetical protein [Kitasatospora camelliae]|uniref:Small CPxCG-related zinc finger protein n=1 Tax=Kitasatospora camelliae TaxID=3156397 RepID=A0AAU8K3P5_9ACTN